MKPDSTTPCSPWSRRTLLAGLGTILAFHAAYLVPHCQFLIVFFLAGLFTLSHLATNRSAFYVGLSIGLAIYAPHLSFFWTIFGPAALALWTILAFWIGLFLVLTRTCRVRLGPVWAAALAPLFWTGLEYFRSELYSLRFGWLNVGYAFADSPQLFVLAGLGVYGIGFELMGGASLLTLLRPRARWITGTTLVLALAVITNWPAKKPIAPSPNGLSVQVAGVQMEFPAELEALQALDQTRRIHPETQLFVCSEYTLDGPVSRHVQQWCEKNARHLIIGGKDYLDTTHYFNTAFVVGPNGQTCASQAKSVPIQFFNDGLPAREQKLWASPWGRIGLGICYDLSYTRVMDRLVRAGAQALIIPTMDLADWGAYEHSLHARIAPMRAAEYGLPTFRVASSGVSQLLNARGAVLASAPFPGDKATITGELRLAKAGVIPIDRWVAPHAALFSLLLGLTFLVPSLGRFLARPIQLHLPGTLASESL